MHKLSLAVATGAADEEQVVDDTNQVKHKMSFPVATGAADDQVKSEEVMTAADDVFAEIVNSLFCKATPGDLYTPSHR